MANFSQRNQGNWQAKIRRKGFPEQVKTFANKADAVTWARAVEREMDIGAFVRRDDAERTTFEDAAMRYQKEILPSKRSREPAACRLRRLVEYFGRYSLASINPAMISTYRDSRSKEVRPQTVVHEINTLSQIFKACVFDWGIALPNGIPTASVRKPKLPPGRDRRLEPGEWELLRAALAACASPYPLAVVEFALETAARQGEIMSLVWKDVDLAKRTARLRGAGGGITKNEDPYRDIPLSPRAGEVLAALPRVIKGKKVFGISQGALVQSWERARDSARRAHINGLVGARLVEAGLSADEAAAQIRALIYKKKTPLPLSLKLLAEIEGSDMTLTDFHFHDLRHEATSRLAEVLQLHELMKVLGHKTVAMLARYYNPRAEKLALKLV